MKVNKQSLVIIIFGFIISYLLRSLFYILRWKLFWLDIIYSNYFDLFWYFLFGATLWIIFKFQGLGETIVLTTIHILLSYQLVGIIVGIIYTLTTNPSLFHNPIYVSAFLRLVLMAIAPLFIILGSQTTKCIHKKFRR